MKRLTLALTLTSFCGLIACGGQPADEATLDVSEGAAYLMTAEDDDGDVAADALGTMDDAAIDDLAREESEEDLNAPERPDIEPCDFEARRARVLAHYDADGSGDLDADERAALREDIQERRADQSRIRRLAQRVRHHRFRHVRRSFDEDDSGDLDGTERQALVDAMEQRCLERRARILDRFDADDDGRLNREEREAFRQARREALAARRAAILERFDANDDGQLDREERAALREAIAERCRHHRARIIAAFDANGDGELDREERAALRRAIRDRITADGDGRPEAERPTDVTRPEPTRGG